MTRRTALSRLECDECGKAIPAGTVVVGDGGLDLHPGCHERANYSRSALRDLEVRAEQGKAWGVWTRLETLYR